MTGFIGRLQRMASRSRSGRDLSEKDSSRSPGRKAWLDINQQHRAVEPPDWRAGVPAVLRKPPKWPELDGCPCTLIGRADGAQWRVATETPAAAPLDVVVGADSLAPLPGWPPCGVSLACLQAFAEYHKSSLAGASTHEVCERLVKPLTEPTGDTLARCIQRAGATDEGSGAPYAAHPTIFISHARECDFLDLVSAIERLAYAQPKPENVYVWIDVFCVPQHAEYARWPALVSRVISAIGHTCLVLGMRGCEGARGGHMQLSEYRPAALDRTWCLFETMSTLNAAHRLSVQFPPAHMDALLRELHDEFARLTKPLTVVNLEESRASDPGERRALVRILDSMGGRDAVSRRMGVALRQWLVNQGRAELMRMPQVERGTSGLITQLGLLLHCQGRLHEAGDLHVQAIAACRERYGEWHFVPELSGSQMANSCSASWRVGYSPIPGIRSTNSSIEISPE